jgi:ATP synthase F1 gamma subunit
MDKCTTLSVVVVSSERSCCGKLNNEVLLATKEAIGSFVDNNKIVSIITIGWKGKNSLAVNHKAELSHSVSYIGKSCFLLSYVVLLSVLDTTYDRCYVFFSRYYKIFEQVAAIYEYHSYNIFYDCIYKGRKSNILFDVLISNSNVNLRNLYFYNACLVLLDAFEETKYSELGCRAFSMEMAHRNATELIVEKMLVYNKARQAGITNDLLEVVAGAIYTV